jgi:hypothetical protein
MKVFNYKTLSLSCLIFLSGCFTIRYDFKGGAPMDPKIKTVSVQYINNRALIVNPTLSQTITDKLRDYMERNTNLKVVNSTGDVDFSGEITSYGLSTAAINSGDRQSQIRFTITVRIKFTNSVNPDNNYDASFSQYRDFASDSENDFTSMEAGFVEEILNELVEQIYNKAFVNW